MKLKKKRQPNGRCYKRAAQPAPQSGIWQPSPVKTKQTLLSLYWPDNDGPIKEIRSKKKFVAFIFTVILSF